MTVQTVADERLGQFARKQHDWFERVRKGSLDPTLVEEAVQRLIDTLPRGRFANEEVASNYGYLSGYKKPVGIEAQIDILRSHWPQLNPDAAIRYMREVYPTLQLPRWVEGPFALIRPGFFSENDGEEIEEVLKAIAKARGGKFHNYRAGHMDRFRRHAHTALAYERICEQQEGSDILVVAAQFGIRHRGKSVRRAREVMQSGEFGLGAFAVGIMLLTHPERLSHYDDLWLDGPGDKFDDPGAGGRFDHAPCFGFGGGEVEFVSFRVGCAFDYCGSVSGVVPQS